MLPSMQRTCHCIESIAGSANLLYLEPEPASELAIPQHCGPYRPSYDTISQVGQWGARLADGLQASQTRLRVVARCRQQPIGTGDAVISQFD